MRTQIPGKQILDLGVETEDLKDAAVTDVKLSTTGVAGGTYTQVTVNTVGRVIAGVNQTTLAGYGITDAQPFDLDLSALANTNSIGFYIRTGNGTSVTRALAQPSAGFTITNADGVAGAPTFALANDLAAIEGLASTGFAVRSAEDTWLTRAIASTTLTLTNADGIAGNPTINLSAAGIAGTYRSVTTDIHGRITSGTNPTTLAGYGITDSAPLAPSYITINSEVSLPNERRLIGSLNQVELTDGGVNSTLAVGLPVALVAPGSFQFSTNFGYATEIIGAGGTDQASATLITKTASVITTGALTSGVRLPVPSFVGEIHVITNKYSNLIYVYPHVGGLIVTGAINVPTFVNSSLAITFVWDGSTWSATAFSITAGNAGIQASYELGNVIVSNTGVLSFSGGSTGLTPVSATAGNIVLDGALGISNGGTGATTAAQAFTNLSPLTTSGDILYRNSSGAVRLAAGAATTVLSISSGVPSWVAQASLNAGTATLAAAATNIAGGAAGQVPYQTGVNGTAFTAVGTVGQVLSGGSTPTFVSIPTALGYTPVNKAGDTMTGSLLLSGDPTQPLGAATKQYVDAISQGLAVQESCFTSTNGVNLVATYNNGSSGLGATLTATTNVVLGSIGGYTPTVGNRVLIKDQSDPIQNGIYTVTALGVNGSSPWQLTRASDFDGYPSGATHSGDFTYIVNGSLAGTTWVLATVANPIVMGTDNILFNQLSGAVSYAAGAGVSIAGLTISNTGVLSTIAGAGISVSSGTGNVTVTNAGVTSITAGAGISVTSSTGAITISAAAVTQTTVTLVASSTLTNGQTTAFVNAGSGAVTVGLPATPTAGQKHTIKKTDLTRQVVLISGNGFNIDKYSTVKVTIPFTSIQVQWNSDTSIWHII